jgi:hypothetical protein
VLTDDGPLPIDVPRDRDGTFEPRFIPKHERRFTGFDDKILALYARGMTVREIQGFLADMYAVEVSPDLISTVTDGIVAEVTAWQSRPLERMYPVVFFDALRVKIRDEATVRSKAIYLALAVLPDGHREILGLWIEQNGGREILDEGLQRPQNPWLSGHPHRRHRWSQGHERGARRGVSADHAADVHRAPDSPQPRLRELERTEADGDRAPADLRGGQCRGPPRPPSTISNAVPGARSFPPSWPHGGALGRTSFRSSRFRRKSVG